MTYLRNMSRACLEALRNRDENLDDLRYWIMKRDWITSYRAVKALEYTEATLVKIIKQNLQAQRDYTIEQEGRKRFDDLTWRGFWELINYLTSRPQNYGKRRPYI
jgi:hypothetical protein